MLIDIESKLHQGKGARYERWAKIFNLKEAAKTLIYLEEHGLDDYEVLTDKAEATGEKFDSHFPQIKVNEKRLSEIANLQKHIGSYSKTREIYMQYRQCNYSKKFLAAHEGEIAIHKAAKQEFDKLGLQKLPSMQSLKSEYAALLSSKNKLYGE